MTHTSNAQATGLYASLSVPLPVKGRRALALVSSHGSGYGFKKMMPTPGRHANTYQTFTHPPSEGLQTPESALVVRFCNYRLYLGT